MDDKKAEALITDGRKRPSTESPAPSGSAKKATSTPKRDNCEEEASTSKTLITDGRKRPSTESPAPSGSAKKATSTPKRDNCEEEASTSKTLITDGRKRPSTESPAPSGSAKKATSTPKRDNCEEEASTSKKKLPGIQGSEVSLNVSEIFPNLQKLEDEFDEEGDSIISDTSISVQESQIIQNYRSNRKRKKTHGVIVTRKRRINRKQLYENTVTATKEYQSNKRVSPKSKKRGRNRKYNQNLTPRRKDKQKSNNTESHRHIRAQATTARNTKRTLFAIENICKKLAEGPIYVCTVCSKLLYKRSVKKINIDKYRSLPSALHEKIFQEDSLYKSVNDAVWICCTCDSNLRARKIPVQAKVNGLKIDEIPESLKELNSLEARLISKRIPFLKLLILPRGRQKGINGPVVNVPAKLEKVCDVLPRLPSEAHLVGIKLKRKLVYKGHYMHQLIRPTKVTAALNWLKNNNPFYFETESNDNWEDEWENEEPELWENIVQSDQSLSDDSTVVDASNVEVRQSGQRSVTNENLSENEENEIHNEIDEEEQTSLDISTELRGLPYSTLLQPDNSIDVMNDTVSIAPAEGEKPVPMELDENFEALAFPSLFPAGNGTFGNKRDIQIPLKRYFNQRILDVDGRFAKDIDYILTSQYMVEKNQVMSDISIMLRQSKGRAINQQNLTAGSFKNSENIETFIREDQAYRCLKNIRGSPSYWSNVQHEAMAMIRQLGKPTWFLTLSAADLQWPEVIQSIGQQYGHNFTEDNIRNMSWEEKCSWLRNNPVTAARHFDHRLNVLFTDFLRGNIAPIGKVVDYIIRIEFQSRGSPHAHSIIWIEDAPSIGKESDREVTEFIDKYQSCQIDSADKELAELVEQRQTHVHSASCRKPLRMCRFYFPHAPSLRTIIARQSEDQDLTNSAQEVLKKVNSIISAKDFDKSISISELCEQAEVDENEYLSALEISKNGTSIILKRSVNEVMVNNYNPHILKVWKANMDIQYIVDPYACIMYIASYVLKQERTMSDTLKCVSKESADQGVRNQLRKVGSVFLNTREVSAQEVVYRLLSIPLKQFSRKVIFVNTNPRERRVSMLKPIAQIKALDDDDENIFQLSLLDRYAARPDSVENMCLAEFAAWYTYSKNVKNHSNESDESDEEEANSVIILKGGLGYMRKRRQAAILRFSTFKQKPDLKYRSRLMLYMPWRDEVEDIDAIPNLEEFSNRNRILIEQKERLFTNSEVSVDEALDQLQEEGSPTHLWDHISPAAQQGEGDDHIEGSLVLRNIDAADIEENARQLEGDQYAMDDRFTVETKKTIMAPEEYRKYFQGLNQEQKKAKLFNRQWCCDALAVMRVGKVPVPYHIFLSGSGGVGKSHVIRLIHNDILRIFRLSGLFDVDDIPVLLVGPTGTSAFAIGGLTVHSAFFFGKGTNTTYHSLSSDRLNSLRLKLGKLQVLIIDEVSMIGPDMLFHIHRRLEDIRGASVRNSRFGNVSVLAVGDLFQLKPVSGFPIFHTPSDPYAKLHEPIWTENFKFLELTEIMRQKDDLRFAEMLNRIRLEEHTEEDVEILRSREIDPDGVKYNELGLQKALHVFATNDHCTQHNTKLLQTCTQQIVTIEATDSTKDEETRQMLVTLPDKRSDTGGLNKVVQICVDARVMLTYNLDVSDGLVNGACGVVNGIIWKNSSEVEVILVKFDDSASGKKASAECIWRRQYPDCVPIERIEVSFSVGKRNGAEVVRKQFPLTLCWALTIHKVQGMTVSRIVVNMMYGTFRAGQAYVALSRVTSLEGLFIVGFKPQKIKADNSVKIEMQRLRGNRVSDIPESNIMKNENCLKITHLNIGCLLGKLEFLHKESLLKGMDIVCFSETWLTPSDRLYLEHLPLADAELFRLDRASVQGLDNVPRGGVLMLVKRNLNARRIVARIPNLEALAVNVSKELSSINIVSVYRKPHGIAMQEFLEMLSNLMRLLPAGETMILGDFNYDSLSHKDSKLEKHMYQNGFKQLVCSVTSERGTCIDHVYCQNQLKVVSPEVHDCFYSDHKFVVVGIEI